MTRADGAILLTGATGFVGMELLARYLERGDQPLVLLVRATDDAVARGRVTTLLRGVFGSRGERYRHRVRAVAADLTAPGLGLTRYRREQLADQVSTIIHSAASVSFTLPVHEAREINLEGTRRMLELAELTAQRGELERYAHVSTAYVAGTHAGPFFECDLDLGQEFRNSYEKSKYEAEQLVHTHAGLPFTIMRPSIIVGDRRSGWTSAFNVLYWPLRAFARGLFTEVPALASAPVDVVSVDYVADAIHELCRSSGGIGDTYHLAAGTRASTIGEIASAASRYFKLPLPRVLPPDQAGRQPAIAGGSAYFPYFSVRSEFDDSAARARLEPLGIRVSPLSEYLERLLDFATRSRWGKLPIARSEALAAG